MLILFSIIISLFVLILSVSFINHQLQLSKEKELFVPTGQLLEINGHQIHVYTEGKGEETLVFMSGGGTSSPVLDFKSLYSLLSDKYKIVVVEKAGYGFSEVTDTNRDIDTILTETKEALFKSGVKGPFILFPHSMSGIEALKWAQDYPDEIKAIIGLDMAVPAAYEELDINMFLVRLGALAANTGLTRWVPNLSENDAIKYGNLTDKEKKLYKAIFYRRTLTNDMINEINNIKANAQKVKQGGMPNIPILLFSSNGVGTGFDNKTWNGIQNDFISKACNGQLVNLDSSHYVHSIDYEQIAEESKKFIASLKYSINF
ncbi:alpha/beta hydrolase [Lysinibacillus mangiferihumi]|uniref:Alpha/beta hydrolase n=1 Tax=Lysinibacillus mangiferihumi TaxID=1130819 RepID=A0A4V5TMK6_9BACI|nr:alpha/beta hydrolase [Lysinibacillus mangiferihumi]TKI66283.1 alpha/beta hydrolase [Lysinibacillus mangiferihumi]